MKNVLLIVTILLVSQFWAQDQVKKDIAILKLEIKELSYKKELKEIQLERLEEILSNENYNKKQLEQLYVKEDSLKELIKKTRKEIINTKTKSPSDIENYETVDKKDEDLTPADLEKMSNRDLKIRKAKISSRISANKMKIKIDDSLTASQKVELEILNTRLSMKLDLIRNELEKRESK